MQRRMDAELQAHPAACEFPMMDSKRYQELVEDIRDHGQAPCEHVRDLLDTRLADIEQQIAQLSALRDTIAALRDEASDPEPETCSPDQVCRYL